MSRYIERAENIARFIDVNMQLTLDRTPGLAEQWKPLVAVTGEYDLFKDRYGNADRHSVMQFLTFDRDYPGSIISCVESARENARTIRDVITAEMWKQINQIYLQVKNAASLGIRHERPTSFYTTIKQGSLLFSGITDATMSRSLGWEFSRLGRMIERADKTSRILDVKYFLLLPSPEDVGSTLDVIQWAALLRSVGGLEMYRQEYGAITPANVARFLLLDQHYPRSVMYCLIMAERSINKIVGPDPSGQSRHVTRCIGRLRSSVEFSEIDEIVTEGLHEYIDRFQLRINEVGALMNEAMFNLGPIPEDATEATPAESAAAAEAPA